MCYRCARPEGTRARLLNALPLRYMSAFTKRSGKNVRFVRFLPPPPLDYYTKGNVMFAFAEAVAASRRTRRAFEDFLAEDLDGRAITKIFKTGGWLCLTDAQRYYTTLQFWQVTGSADGVYPGYLAHFSPYFVSYAGCGRDGPRSQGDMQQSRMHPSHRGYPRSLGRFA